MTFQKFPLAFRAGQFVDNSADNLTFQCRDYDTYRYTVTLTLGLWQQITSLRLVPIVITVTMIRVIHPHHNADPLKTVPSNRRGAQQTPQAVTH